LTLFLNVAVLEGGFASVGLVEDFLGAVIVLERTIPACKREEVEDSAEKERYAFCIDLVERVSRKLPAALGPVAFHALPLVRQD
jgi:hypothetical protein